jgi:DNA-binding transcriptional LysR family regulator
MNPTLRQLRALVALARSGNFTLAAQSLHVTQSALSGLIKELEQTRGARVADRKHSHSTLTDIGRARYIRYSARSWTTSTVRSRTLPTKRG